MPNVLLNYIALNNILHLHEYYSIILHKNSIIGAIYGA